MLSTASLYKRFCGVFTLLGLILLSQACTLPNTVTIEAPADNSLHGVPPTIYSIQFADPLAEGQVLKVRLNSTDVSSWFTVSADRFTAVAQGTNLAAAVIPGNNVFAITAPFRTSTTFYYDTFGPDVHISKATSNGSGLAIEGYLADRAGATGVRVNGVSAQVLSNNRFTASANVAPIMQISADDRFGNTSETRFARPGTQIDESVIVEFNNAALAKFGPKISEFIGSVDLTSIELGGKPLIYTHLNGTDKTDIYLTSLSIGSVEAKLMVDQVHADGTLDVASTTRSNAFGVELDITAGGLYLGNFPGIISTTAIGITADTAPSLSADGTKVEMPVTNLVLDLSAGFTYNIPNLPAQILAEFDALVPQIGQAIGDNVVANVLPQALDSVMNPLLSFPLNFASTQVDIAAQAQTLGVQGDSLNLALKSTLSTAAAVANVNPTLGSRFQLSTAPQLGTLSPNQKPFDLGLLLSSNTINQLLLTSYESGQFAFVDSRTIDFSALGVVGVLLNNEISATDNVQATITAISPPFIELGSYPGALGKMLMHDLQVEFSVRFAGDATYTPTFKAVINVDAPFSLTAASNGDIQIGLNGAPKLEVVSSVTITGEFVWGNELIERLLNAALAEVLPSTLNSISSIPVPDMNGLSLSIVDIWAASDAHIAVGANLTTLP